MTKPSVIPLPIINLVSGIIPEYTTHDELNLLFSYIGAPGAPPDGSKRIKIRDWLVRCNQDVKIDSISILGKVLEEFMDSEIIDGQFREEEKSNERRVILNALHKHNLEYLHGGIIRTRGAAPTRSLEAILAAHDFPALEQEFKRALDNAETDPATSITAACALVEALCKRYIRDKGLTMPKDKSIKPLWHTVRIDIGFDPSRIEDADLLKILGGLSSIVDGLGALRTHAGNAHGRDEGDEAKPLYNVEPRHARLANHAAHTVATFLIETWQARERALSDNPIE